MCLFGYLLAPQLILSSMHLFHHRKYYDQSDSTSEQHLPILLFVLCSHQAQRGFWFFFFPYWNCILNIVQWNKQDRKFFWWIYLYQIKLMLTTCLWVQEFGNFLEVADFLQDTTSGALKSSCLIILSMLFIVSLVS